jgi:cysteinyl-tRNA synthetase
MTLHLYDAAAREVRQFQPLHPGRVSLYARGTTVRGLSDIGQLRLAVCADIVIRWLEAAGYRVTYCRNVTGLDKAVRAAADAQGTPWWVLAERARRCATQGSAALACRPPDVDPRTVGQVPEMIACFGPVFDIHAENADLIRPGRGRYCLPVGQARVAGSLAGRATDCVRPVEVRYFLAQDHYRAAVECTGARLEEAAAAYQRIERFVTRAHRMVSPASDIAPGGGSTSPDGAVPISFAAAMDDDLDVSRALMAVHATVHDGNYAIRSGDRDAVAASLAQVRTMLAALGLDPLNPHWATSDSSGRLHGVIDGLVDLALRQQEAARARGDYASAGSIQDTLETMGVEVEDTASGPRWELKR